MEKLEKEGFLFINKPPNITSFECIRHLKKIINQKIKIGHTGTLDPFATGLLIVCIGRQATKSISKFMNFDKEYIVTAKLGELTDTLDHTGTTLETNKKIIPDELIPQAIKDLGASYLQTPPMYSALKYLGQPLYKLARTKKLSTEQLEKIINTKKRLVKLYNIELLEFNFPYFTFKAHVSKGTYIRTLANDIAQKCHTHATTYKLQRTKIGPFSLEKAIDLDTIKIIDDIINNTISIEEIIPLIEGYSL